MKAVCKAIEPQPNHSYRKIYKIYVTRATYLIKNGPQQFFIPSTTNTMVKCGVEKVFLQQNNY